MKVLHYKDLALLPKISPDSVFRYIERHYPNFEQIDYLVGHTIDVPDSVSWLSRVWEGKGIRVQVDIRGSIPTIVGICLYSLSSNERIYSTYSHVRVEGIEALPAYYNDLFGD